MKFGDREIPGVFQSSENNVFVPIGSGLLIDCGEPVLNDHGELRGVRVTRRALEDYLNQRKSTETSMDLPGGDFKAAGE